jgi:hypothetical protein
MRFIVFLLGILGSLLCGFFGWYWIDQANHGAIQKMATDAGLSFIAPNYTGEDFDLTMRAGVFLLAGTAIGLLGSLFTVLRYGRQGAVLMLLAVIGPAIFNLGTLVFTAVLALAGLLSLLVRPCPPSAA